MRCPDCPEQPGKYIGANVVEDCQRCEGVGELNDDGSVIESKAKALKSVFNSNLPEWMKDYADQIGVGKLDDPDPYGSIARANYVHGQDPLKVGDSLYVFDCDWYETTVTRKYNSGSNGTPPNIMWIDADGVYSSFIMPLSDICWNLTQGRWEYIRAGTPVWP
jgi:hypothetical protein